MKSCGPACLTLVLGNTHYSVSTVLTTFMGGLALGSFFGGRLIDRGGRPLLIYALLEGTIGIYCLLIPFFIDASLPFFQWIYLNFQESYSLTSFFRFSVCGAILLVPASLMGATLPILGKFVSDDPDVIGRDVGTLYAVNTFGAVAGALNQRFCFHETLRGERYHLDSGRPQPGFGFDHSYRVPQSMELFQLGRGITFFRR